MILSPSGVKKKPALTTANKRSAGIWYLLQISSTLKSRILLTCSDEYVYRRCIMVIRFGWIGCDTIFAYFVFVQQLVETFGIVNGTTTPDVHGVFGLELDIFFFLVELTLCSIEFTLIFGVD